jgi:hypothetical protein
MGRVASITVLAGDGYDGEEVLGASWKRVVANSTQPEHIRHPWLRCSFPGRPVRELLGIDRMLRTSNPSPQSPANTVIDATCHIHNPHFDIQKYHSRNSTPIHSNIKPKTLQHNPQKTFSLSPCTSPQPIV